MIKIILLILFSFKPITGCMQADIVLVVDQSWSVNGHQSYIADALDAFVNRFELNDNGIRLGMITFSGAIHEYVSLTSNRNYLDQVIYKIRNREMFDNTNLRDALKLANTELQKNGRSYQILILICDGKPDSDQQSDAMWQSEQIKKRGVTIFGILIDSNDSAGEYMEQISSPGWYVYTHYQDLVMELETHDLCL